MTEINTFSAAVDDAVTRAGRPDRVADTVSFVRMTIRELQTLKGYFFDNDIVEDVIVATAEPFVWTADELLQKRWRTMRAVQYPNLFAPDGKAIVAHYVGIGKAQQEVEYYYYKSGNSYVFTRHGGDNVNSVNINIAYYAYAKVLAYYKLVADRPATFSLETNTWAYKTIGTPDENLISQGLVTNWLLEKWYDAVVEGALAKLYKTVDDTRSRSTFALYSSYKLTLTEAEPRSHFGIQM